jgi:hypothetical protein
MHSPVELQQPFWQATGSHTHWPVVLHVWPAAHASHSAPPVPHEVAACALNRSHFPAAVQQPCGQLAALHGFTPPSAAASWPPSVVASMPPSFVVTT